MLNVLQEVTLNYLGEFCDDVPPNLAPAAPPTLEALMDAINYASHRMPTGYDTLWVYECMRQALESNIRSHGGWEGLKQAIRNRDSYPRVGKSPGSGDIRTIMHHHLYMSFFKFMAVLFVQEQRRTSSADRNRSNVDDPQGRRTLQRHAWRKLHLEARSRAPARPTLEPEHRL